MTWEWKIGDPVDDANGGSMEPENWGHGGSDENDENTGGHHDSRPDQYGKKAYDLYMDFSEDEALRYINMALDLDDMHATNWNRKGIILEALERYAESEECYNRSLELSPTNIVYDNKARMLYDWAAQLLEKSKELSDGRNMLDEAYNKIVKAMKALPGENSVEDINKYLGLRDSINFYIDYERKYHNNLETLSKYPKNELFTITGRQHYGNVPLIEKAPLRRVKEPVNEFDNDAIAVYSGDEKIGYVANNDGTKSELTSSASQLKNEIQDVAEAEFLLYLERYEDIRFFIGRIIK